MKSIFNIKSFTLIFLLLGLIFIQAGCEDEADAGYGRKKMDIVDTAASADEFGTLVTALKAAELVETLKGHGPFTVFAPTDDAFAKLPEGTLDDLLEPENKEKLTSILTYHVVSGRVPAGRVVKLNSAKTLNGKEVSIKVENGDVMINDAKVIKTDIHCTNGIIHVIDTVLMP